MVGSQNTSRPRILIVDDELQVRQLLSDALQNDFDCSAAATAAEALQLINGTSVDLVLSDIDLGAGPRGTELVPEIFRISPDTVVVMISGNQGIDDAIEAMRAGAFDYLKKPFDLDYLDLVVRRAYAHRLLLVEKRRYERDLEHLVRQSAERLNYLSFYDPLTDLPNRSLFEDRVTQALIAADGASKIALILLSIDGFRKVQQTLGHANSDQMLTETGIRLRQGVGQGSTVSRHERDEFAVLMTSFETEEDLADTAREIAESIKRPFMLDGSEVVVTCSIGISISPADGADLSTLMKNAAAARARSREQGGDRVRFYTGDMNARALKRFTLETGLRRAIEREEFEVYYQPKVDIYSGRICGSEALVRWHHPEIGLVSPLEFIPLAEETGLIMPLGEWVLSTAVVQTKKWNDDGFDLSVAVNLSVRHLQHKGLAPTVLRIVEAAQLEPRLLNIEITESSVIQHAEIASASLWKLKEKGIQVSLDDFGTGYSSLSYLKKLPIDVIKIDKSFVKDLPNDADDAALTIAIISLGHNLRLKVVAEGVEKEEQLQFLHRLGCDEYQGFYFSKPVAVPDFEVLMRAHAIRHSSAVY